MRFRFQRDIIPIITRSLVTNTQDAIFFFAHVYSRHPLRDDVITKSAYNTTVKQT